MPRTVRRLHPVCDGGYCAALEGFNSFAHLGPTEPDPGGTTMFVLSGVLDGRTDRSSPREAWVRSRSRSRAVDRDGGKIQIRTGCGGGPSHRVSQGVRPASVGSPACIDRRTTSGQVCSLVEYGPGAVSKLTCELRT